MRMLSYLISLLDGVALRQSKSIHLLFSLWFTAFVIVIGPDGVDDLLTAHIGNHILCEKFDYLICEFFEQSKHPCLMFIHACVDVCLALSTSVEFSSAMSRSPGNVR